MFEKRQRFFVVLAMLVVACSQADNNPTDATGGLDQPCRANSTCNPGLLCEEDICVEPSMPPDAGEISSDAGTSPPDSGVERCANFKERRNTTHVPAKVTTYFSLTDCDEKPLVGLGESDFSVLENDVNLGGMAVGPYVIEQEKGFRYYYHIVVDLRDTDRLTNLVSALKAMVTELIAEGGQHFASVSTFDGRSRLIGTTEFSNRPFELTTYLDTLLMFNPQGSNVSLSGAFWEGLDRVEAIVDSSSVAVTQGSLIVITTGDDVSPSPSVDRLAGRVAQGSTPVFAIALGEQAPKTLLMDWTNRPVQAVEENSELTSTLRALGEQFYGATEGNYIVSYCSEKRAATHSVSIGIPGRKGALAFEFSADGFSDGCSETTIREPCATRVCGTADGIVCGQCAAGKVCDLNGVCTDEPLAPSRPEISVSPESPSTLDALMCSVDTASIDPNQDEVQYLYRWQKEGMDAGINTSSVAARFTTKNEVWQCTVTPSDGTLEGESATARVTIVNSVPTQPSIAISPAMPYTTDDLTCSITAPSTDSDRDALSYEFTWINGATAVTGPVLSSTLTSKNQRWRCSVAANDGEQSSVAAQSPQLLIQNTPPSTPTIEITPGLATDRDDLNCDVTIDSVDPDNDPVSYTYQWSNGTQTLPPGPVLNRQETNAGDQWTCTVTPNDFSVDGIPAVVNTRVWDGCRALDFDGIDDHVAVGSNGALRLTGTISIEFWLKPDSLAAGSLVRFGGDPNGGTNADNVLYRVALANSPGHIAFSHEYGNGLAESFVTGSSMVQSGRWHHIALVRDALIRTYRLFVDGTPLPFILFSSNAFGGSGGELSFGGTVTATHAPQFDGHLDEIRIWDRILSQQEIQNNMSTTLDPSQTNGLVGYWPLLSNTGTTAIDHTGQGNNGAIQGASWSSTSLCDGN